jgi:hypothetical protein
LLLARNSKRALEMRFRFRHIRLTPFQCDFTADTTNLGLKPVSLVVRTAVLACDEAGVGLLDRSGWWEATGGHILFLLLPWLDHR